MHSLEKLDLELATRAENKLAVLRQTANILLATQIAETGEPQNPTHTEAPSFQDRLPTKSETKVNTQQIDPSNITGDWQDYANCIGEPPNTFFPSDGVGVEDAKKICSECVVKEQCLEYALVNRIDHGVWGGESERRRRRILKQRSEQIE